MRPPVRTADFCSYGASLLGCAAIIVLGAVALYVMGRIFGGWP